MRGRLIQKFKVVIARLDTVATGAVVGGGWDPDFHEPVPVEDGTQVGADSRRYHPEETFTCQLDRKTWGKVDATRGGQEKEADIIIVLHWPELQKRGLIDSNGQPLFRRGDKVIRILTKKGVLDLMFDDPPGMFITEWDRAGHGLAAFGTPKTNLLYLYCNYDKKGVSTI
jgi:hypothetical protein